MFGEPPGFPVAHKQLRTALYVGLAEELGKGPLSKNTSLSNATPQNVPTGSEAHPTGQGGQPPVGERAIQGQRKPWK